jgi:glycosyltransferase involved in cell wall biosynthesis
MSNSLPTVSVVMPVLNFAAFVAETLESVLAQTYAPLEFIVIDNGSTDGTSEIIERYVDHGVQHIVRTDRQDMYSAHNLAIRMAKGEMISFISGDDRWLPEKLAKQAALMAENPQFGYSITHAIHFIDPNYPPPPERVREAHLEMRKGPLLESTMARKILFEEYGGFVEDYLISGDVEWFARMDAKHVPMGVVEEVLVHKRLHSNNASTRNPALTRAELLRIMRDAARARTQHNETPEG